MTFWIFDQHWRLFFQFGLGRISEMPKYWGSRLWEWIIQEIYCEQGLTESHNGRTDLCPSFLLVQDSFNSLMNSFNYRLTCGGVGNACGMLDTPQTKEFLEFVRDISWTITGFYFCRDTQGGKARRKCFITSSAFSPAWADAKTAPENVSTETCTYFDLPNCGTWVTSLCQISQLLRPRGLTLEPSDGTW